MLTPIIIWKLWSNKCFANDLLYFSKPLSHARTTTKFTLRPQLNSVLCVIHHYLDRCLDTNVLQVVRTIKTTSSWWDAFLLSFFLQVFILLHQWIKLCWTQSVKKSIRRLITFWNCYQFGFGTSQNNSIRAPEKYNMAFITELQWVTHLHTPAVELPFIFS